MEPNSLTIINNYFFGLEAFCLYRVNIKERQKYNTADGKTGQHGNCRSLKSSIRNRLALV